MSASIGSGLFKKMVPNFPHLSQGSHGMTGEIADLRRDIAFTLTPLAAICIEEYTAPPAAVPAAIMAVTASSTSAQTYSLAALTGSIGRGAISPPRNLTVTTAGVGADAPASVTINGIDINGSVISETLSGTNATGTVTGAKCFAKVTSVVTPAAAAADATISVGTGIVVGLANKPKIRTGAALPLVRRELVDGALVATGVLTLPATNLPNGAYTPAAAPNGTHNYAIEYEFDASLQPDQ